MFDNVHNLDMFYFPVFVHLRLLDTFGVKINEKQTPLHIILLLGSFHFLPGGGVSVCGGGQNFLGRSDGGAILNYFCIGQQGAQSFLRM